MANPALSPNSSKPLYFRFPKGGVTRIDCKPSEKGRIESHTMWLESPFSRSMMVQENLIPTLQFKVGELIEMWSTFENDEPLAL